MPLISLELMDVGLVLIWLSAEIFPIKQIFYNTLYWTYVSDAALLMHVKISITMIVTSVAGADGPVKW